MNECDILGGGVRSKHTVYRFSRGQDPQPTGSPLCMSYQRVYWLAWVMLYTALSNSQMSWCENDKNCKI